MSLFSKLSLVPKFSPYGGPYAVGSCDVELAAHDLDAPSPAPEDSNIGTVSFRVFYPCEADMNARPIRWLPSPQKAYLSAYARFLGANSLISEAVSLFPQLLFHTSIPAHRNAKLLTPPTKSGKWPVMIFSHGLGGSRNTYSQILGNVASHGIVVIAADHRDKSSPISYVRATDKTEAQTVDYEKMAHTPTAEVYAGRDKQLKIRLWELGLIHDATLKIDKGHYPHNLDPNSSSHKRDDTIDVLKMFVGNLDVHEPGTIIWAGHSFGAATIVQLLKSTYWQTREKGNSLDAPLFNPSPTSSIANQISPSSPAILLDMWCLPFRSNGTRSLWEKPMPCYAPSGPGGVAILAVLSEAFFKWSGNIKDTKRVLCPPTGTGQSGKPGPRLFYPQSSAHLSQSDFGVLFPWLTRKVLKTDDPERYIQLNARAILQVLRENEYDLAGPSMTEVEEDTNQSKSETKDFTARKNQDWKILDGNGAVPGWVAIEVSPEADSHISTENDVQSPSDTVVENEVLGDVKM